MLTWFGSKEGESKRAYRQFIKKGVDQRHRPDLVGGGLIRLQGGWSAVKTMRRPGVREKSDERILGRGEFRGALSKQTDRTRIEQFSLHERLKRAASYIQKICKDEKVSVEWSNGVFR